MQPATQPRSRRAEVISLPVLDDQRQNIERWIDWLDEGRPASVRRALGIVLPGLQKVRRSNRHMRLAEFLQYASLALETGEATGARYILLTALATFRWRE